METRNIKTEQFSEDLYFMLMTSSLRDRIRSLGARHGLANKSLRHAILSAGEQVTRRIELSVNPVICHSCAQAG
ncbi:MAG: hypothetical protein JW828_13375 [Sedimentisphaerales bacterium]|nr:hypothetical protein [Sedimentisphaerales bacterium]